jgi:polyphosphate kinase
MERNLDNRVEVTTPVFDSEVRAQIRNVIGHQLKGTAKARILDKDMKNQFKHELYPGKELYRSQYETYAYFKRLLMTTPTNGIEKKATVPVPAKAKKVK